MADYVAIANLALFKLGEAYRISSPTQDGTAAEAIAGVWDQVRRATLRKGKFNFSMTRAELAAQAPTAPGYQLPYPFANRFPVPSDCLRLVEVLGPSSIADAYKFERRAILADSDGPVYIRYVADVVDTTQWDDLFVEAIACLIAFQIADRVTGDRGRKADAWAGFRQAIAVAGGTDAQEDPPEEFPDSSWITARGGV